MITLKEYSEQAHSFANYEQPSYPQFALFEEIGELIGKFAKLKRGDYKQDEKWHLLVKKEIGDLFWCLNELIIIDKDTLDNVFQELSFAHKKRRGFNELLFLIFDSKNTLSFTVSLLLYLIYWQDYNLYEILQLNIDKLNDRKNRNVINGEGDNR